VANSLVSRVGAKILSGIKGAFSFDRIMAMALLALFLVVRHVDPYPVEFLRVKTFDIFQQIKPRDIPPPARKPVTIIDLDEKSLAEVGQWPWPRDKVAQMVKNLQDMGALLVAFDIVFAEEDNRSPHILANNIKGLDEATKEKLRSLPSNDQILADVIKRGNKLAIKQGKRRMPYGKVIMGQAGYWDELDDTGKPAPIKKSFGLLKKKTDPHASLFVPGFNSLITNTPVLDKFAAGHGIFSLVPEPDGIVRRIPTVFKFKNKLYPSLSLEMLRVAAGRRTVNIRSDSLGIVEIPIARGFTMPTDKNGRVWPYFSKSDKAKYVSARDVLNGTVDRKLIAGKMTIVGTSAVGLLDIRATPVDPVIPGVEAHVQLIEAALNKQFLSRPGYLYGAEFMLILLGGILMIWLVPTLGAKWTMLLFLVIAIGMGGTSWYLFSEERILFDAGFGILSIMLLYTLLTYTGYAKEEAERRQTRDAFGKYLSPDMVERVAGDPSSLKLGGEQRELTLLFCDVRGFTTISEQFDAVGLTNLINKLLTPLTNVIMAHSGTVDKYMGDCIMAFWNAPLDVTRHAYEGCISALGMLAEIEPLNERLRIEATEEGRKHIPLQVGLGLNTGLGVVGNMGSDQRFDYSVLGDCVNLAARLEGQSKSYGVDIVIGHSTRDLVPELATIPLDFIQVKGKTEGVYIFALMGDEKIAAEENFLDLKKTTQEMIDLYTAQDWVKAREKIAECRSKLGEHRIAGLYDLYEERVTEYETTPPPEGWDGVFIATTK
jgi:adenylate cyclase